MIVNVDFVVEFRVSLIKLQIYKVFGIVQNKDEGDYREHIGDKGKETCKLCIHEVTNGIGL